MTTAAVHRRTVLLLLLISALALALRVPGLSQSLWYDEMYTLLHYIAQPWSQIVAGEYSPNNHTLFTIAAKGCFLAGLSIRLPSLLAGAAVGIVLAWPLRRTAPATALVVAAVAALHPWLISFSISARGYALMLLLCAVATTCLPIRPRLIDSRYALLSAASLYTQPLALLAIVGHGVSVLVLRRDLLSTWVRSAAAAGALAAILYWPMLAGAAGYWSGPSRPSTTYGQFVAGALTSAQTGLDHAPAVHLVVAAVIVLIGGAAAWPADALRPALITFAVAAGLGLTAPLLVPAAGEARAMLWLIPLYCIGATGLLSWPAPGILRWACGVVLLAVLAASAWTVLHTPAQPIREAIALARATAGPGGRVLGIYMASAEARRIYGGIDAVAYSVDEVQPADVAVVFYEDFVRRDQPELWNHLQDNYALVQRLPGRVAPAAVYRRRP